METIGVNAQSRAKRPRMTRRRWIELALGIAVFSVCAFAGAKFGTAMLDYTPPTAAASAESFESDRRSAGTRRAEGDAN